MERVDVQTNHQTATTTVKFPSADDQEMNDGVMRREKSCWLEVRNNLTSPFYPSPEQPQLNVSRQKCQRHERKPTRTFTGETLIEKELAQFDSWNQFGAI